MSEFQTNLATGIAVALNTAALAVWSTSGVYTAAQTGIVLGNIPQTPDNAITLTTYGVSDSAALSDSVIGLQVRCRTGGADKRTTDDLDDTLFAFLHGKRDWTLSTGVHVVKCLRNSGPASLGQDTNARWGVTSNYYLTCWRPSTNRT
jgi:hypothetical protein